MWESRVLQRAFERLELHEGKLSRAVLRGGGGGDVTSLPDPPVERLARFGFIDDPKDPDRPFPVGLGWVLDPVGGDKVTRDYHSVTLTCAACHVGEVKVGPKQYQLLVGAPNTRIDVRKFRRAIELSTDRLLATEPALKSHDRPAHRSDQIEA